MRSEQCSGQIATSPSSRGPATGPGAVEREGEHVGRGVPAAVLAVELPDPVGVDDLDREVAVVDPGRGERRRDRVAQLGRDVAQVNRHPRAAVCCVVGGDDPLDQLVADDVLAAEADEGDVLDLVEDVADDDQARALVARQVDLGDVAGDDHPRVEAEPGEEHLHLLGARVLRLVEDHEGVVEGVMGQ